MDKMKEMMQRLEALKPAQFRPPPVIKCQDCKDEEWIRVKDQYGHERLRRCACFFEKIAKEKLSVITDRFSEASFANYRPMTFRQPDEKKVVLPDAMVSNPFQGYLLAGDFGVGKTHLMISQYRALTERKFFKTVIIKEFDLLMDLQRQSYDNEYVPKISLDELGSRNKFHLFIDDLGKTKLTEDRAFQLFRLIDIFYENKFGLTVTTNFKLSELEKRWEENYGGGLVRRLKDICQLIYMYESV